MNNDNVYFIILYLFSGHVANGDVQHEDDSMEMGQFEDAMDE